MTSRKKAHLEHGNRKIHRPIPKCQIHLQSIPKKAKQNKKGRHPKLTRSEKRKLARLYIYTQLSTEEICKVLEKLHGKSISVRCAQNNIQDILRADPLLKARPRNRDECRQRIASATHSVAIEQCGSQRGQPPRDSQIPDFPLRDLPTISITSRQENDSTFGLLASDKLRHINEPEEEVVGLPWEVPQDIMQPGKSTNVQWSSDGHPYVSALREDYVSNNDRGQDVDYHPGPDRRWTCPLNDPLPTISEDSSQDIMHLQDSTPTCNLMTSCRTMNPHMLFTTEIQQADLGPPFPIVSSTVPEPKQSATFEEDVIDEGFHSTRSIVGDAYCAIGDAEIPALCHSIELDTEPLLGVPDPLEASPSGLFPSHGFDASFESLQMPYLPILSDDPSLQTRDNTKASRVDGVSLHSSYAHRAEARSTFSSTRSLGSLGKRLSYTSSQMGDIVTAFKHLSFSSKKTSNSSHTVSTIDILDGYPQSKPQEMMLDAIYRTQSSSTPVLIKAACSIDELIISSRCRACGLVLRELPCTSCKDSKSIEPYIENHARSPPLILPQLDRFKNSAFHIVAAAGGDSRSFLTLLRAGCDPNAVNSAGQTFLHVISPYNLWRWEHHLPALLSHLSVLALGRMDCQGVNALQALLLHELHHSTISNIFETLRIDKPLMTSRDNLGRTCHSRLQFLELEARGDKYMIDQPERHSALVELLWKLDQDMNLETMDSLAFDKIPYPAPQDDEEELEHSLHQSLALPMIEDIYGRNGLHCFAGLRAKSPGPLLDDEWASILHGLPHPRHRRMLFGKLLEADVKINAYDKAGNTPLLAFLESHSRGNFDDREMQHYLRKLISARAQINNRNRSGESALHVAVKSGLISAAKDLIKLGANPHARQKEGKGIVKVGLEAAQEIQQQSKKDKALHIRIMTCVHIARKAGAVLEPTFRQEWEA